MATSILQAAGYHTGLYTSPHLHSFRARMRLDGELIPRQRLAALWEQIRLPVKAMERTTTFEIITLLAFMYFAQEEVDWAVLEVGLGGRLDATNVVQPQACAITSLSYEHTDLLGHTLSLIAFEKAGIIKPGVPVVVGPQAPEALAVIESVAEETGADLWQVRGDWPGYSGNGTDADWWWDLREATDHGCRFDIHGPDMHLEGLEVPLVGYHQAANAAVAVALIHALQESGVDISSDDIRRGLAQTYWPGRLECLSREPLILVDSAHNHHSADHLRRALDLYPYERLILLFGASADKDIDGMLEVLATDASAIIVTRSFHPRAADTAILAELARKAAPATPVHVTGDTGPALELAVSLAGPDDLILVTGSIFVVAAARESWLAMRPDAFSPDDWVHHAEPIDGEFTPMIHSAREEQAVRNGGN